MVQWPLILLAGTSLAGAPEITGSGSVKTEERVVKDFHALSIEGPFQVILEVADKQSVTLSGDDNVLPAVETRVEEGILLLRTLQPVRPTKPLTARIQVRSLSRVDVSGSTTLSATKLRGKALEVHVSGAAKMQLAGEVESFTLTSSGAGDISAEQLQTRKTQVSISGAARVDVHATELLDVTISGAGTLRYAGQPKTIKKNISGVGTISAR